MSDNFFSLSMILAMHMENLIEVADLCTALASENNQ